MISQREDEHVETGLDFLTEQFEGKPVIEAILSAALARVQTLEEELWIVMWGWVLDYAEGDQLEDIGAIVSRR